MCAVRIRISIAQLPTINYNEGFVGHFDGTTPVIDENDTIEDKEIQKFWKENWGKLGITKIDHREQIQKSAPCDHIFLYLNYTFQ